MPTFTILKKIIVISFLFVFLCANTEIAQLLKLSNLIEHFSEHHNHFRNQNVSLLYFMAIHYNDNQHHSNNGKDNHENLPFKTVDTSVNQVLAFENHTTFSFRTPSTVSLKSTVPFHQKFYISNVFACIWQPPKLS